MKTLSILELHFITFSVAKKIYLLAKIKICFLLEIFSSIFSFSISQSMEDRHASQIALFLCAFVFAAMCSCCFHTLTAKFQKNCVLFPRTMLLSSEDEEYGTIILERSNDTTHVYIKTQWTDERVCYLPLYVPLLSAIFGVVWASMFLMCSTGGHVNSGLLRPWRIVPPAFVFSAVMAAVCMYTTSLTHDGLNSLSSKIGQIVDDAKYAGVHSVHMWAQFTVWSAWLHTLCWLSSAFLTAARVLLVVDFQLVRIKVTLHADIDRVLERYEEQIRVVSADLYTSKYGLSGSSPESEWRTDSLSKLSNEGTSKVQFRRATADARDPVSGYWTGAVPPKVSEYGARKVKSLLGLSAKNHGIIKTKSARRARSFPSDKYKHSELTSDNSNPTNTPHLKDRLLMAMKKDSALSLVMLKVMNKEEKKEPEKKD